MKHILNKPRHGLGISFLVLVAFSALGVLIWVSASVTLAGEVKSSSDHDNDGLTDSQEVDDDGDGFPDCIEKKFYRHDHDNDGIKDSADPDDDNDGIADTQDDELLDKDNDGVSDAVENRLTSVEKDSDGDGILDRVEKKIYRRDHDNDGTKDVLDSDDDADGLVDADEDVEFKRDHDNDGKKDKRDLDDDGDGIRDFDEADCFGWFDQDNDGVQDNIDTDSGGDDDEPVEEAVSIDNLAFSPSTVTISVGDSVVWTNNDNTSHTVSSDTGAFDSGVLASGDTFSLDFSTAGTYEYHCNFHPSMTGTVVVQ